MEPEVLIALFGFIASVASGMGVQWVSGRREDRRARLERRATRLDETRAVLEEAAAAFVTARIALDIGLTSPGESKLDSAALYAPLATQESRIALRFGSSNSITKEYAKAVKLWADALNLAAEDLEGNAKEIVALRDGAYDAHARFLDLAAPLVGPDSEDQPRLPPGPS